MRLRPSPLRGPELVVAAAVTVVAASGVVTALTHEPEPACRPASARVVAAVEATLGEAPPPAAPPLAEPVVLTPSARLVGGLSVAAEEAGAVLVAGYVDDRGLRHGPAVWQVVPAPGPDGPAEPVVRDLVAASLSPALGADLDDDTGAVGTVRGCARDAAG